MMFSAFCPTHGSTVLMTRRNVTEFANTTNGPVLFWRCNCGHEGALDRTGSTPLRPPALPDRDAAPHAAASAA